MTRRRFLALSLTAVVAGLAVGVFLLRDRTAITRENAALVREGMSMAAVEATLGGPPRDETTTPVAVDMEDEIKANMDEMNLAATTLAAKQRPDVFIWRSDHVVIWVHVEGDVVWHTGYTPVRPIHEGPLARVRRWLGL